MHRIELSTEAFHFYGSAEVLRKSCIYTEQRRLILRKSYISREESHECFHRTAIFLRNDRRFTGNDGRILRKECLILKITVTFLQDDTTFSSRSVVPGGRECLYCFPLFPHDQLITTSVTSHSNEPKLHLEAIVVEQRKDKYWLLMTGYLAICCGCVRFVVYIVFL